MKKKLSNTFAISLVILTLSGCSSRKNEVKAPVDEKIITTHSWYYLTPDGFTETDLPENAPRVIKKPWTESVRISGMGQTAMTDSTPKVYALVNHTGIIEFNSNNAALYTDKLLFKDITADGLVFMGDIPVFSLYKNNLFNESISHNSQKDVSVLVQFDTNTNSFFPILNTQTLKLDSSAQVSDYYWDGESWYYCIKNSLENKTEFTYIKWNPKSSLLSMLPSDSALDKETNIDRKTKISLQKSSENEFRKCKEPLNFSKAPDRVKKLLSCLPEDFAFSVECKTASGPSSRTYEKKVSGADYIAEGKIQLSDIWVATLFNDGTIYFSGALHGRRIINDSKAIALRLPKLPEGFIYSDFGISGNMLYASWEEVSFYETGRAGFLSVDLGKVLYND